MIKILKTGGILIEDKIVCDGHHPNATLRIQSHIHTDHLAEFGASKQQHPIIMSTASKKYLSLSKYNMDIAHRPGVIGLDYGELYEHDGYKIRLLYNEHCIGSSQIEIISPSGESYGYSGDFYYPMKKVINVKNLIIDGSCGGIYKYRSFTRLDSIKALEIKLSYLIKKAPVYIIAHRGLLEKIYFWIEDICPSIIRVGSSEFIESLKLHEDYSYGVIRNTITMNSQEDIDMKRSGKHYMQFIHKKEQIFDIETNQIIQCERFIDNTDYPLKEISPLCCYVSFSDHADINGTFDYIKQVKPEYVYIDGVRSNNNYVDEFSNLITNNCGINCNVLRPNI